MWVALALLSRGIPRRADAWIDPLFGAALIATYASLWAAAIAVSRRPRRAVLHALATTLSVLGMVGVLELAARLRLVHWTLVFNALSREDVGYQSAFVPDAELGFRRIPGQQRSGRPPSDIEAAYNLPRSLRRTITFTYDRWGYRNATEMEEADVVLLGDSFVEGWYVSDEETVAAQLTKRLGRPVANLGVAGYGTLQALRVLEGDAMRRRPRVVAWFFFEGNDLYDDHSFEIMLDERPRQEDAAPPAKGETRNREWRKSSFIRNALQRIRRFSHPLVPNQAPYWATLRRPGRDPERIFFFGYAGVPWTEYEEHRWSVARAALEKGVAFARDHDFELVFLYVPIKFRVYDDLLEIPADSPMVGWKAWPLLPVYFQDFCESASVACVDLTARLRQGVREGRLTYALNDTHWSPEGHAVAATALAEVIRERGW